MQVLFALRAGINAFLATMTSCFAALDQRNAQGSLPLQLYFADND